MSAGKIGQRLAERFGPEARSLPRRFEQLGCIEPDHGDSVQGSDRVPAHLK
jgi:hypothetical protein